VDIPKGYALVPIEPTDEMYLACRRALKKVIEEYPPERRNGMIVPAKIKARARWQAMVAAAPEYRNIKGQAAQQAIDAKSPPYEYQPPDNAGGST